MPHKTISLSESAYRKLRSARQHPRESFSSVVERAQWAEKPHTGAAILKLLETRPFEPRSEKELDYLDQRQLEDFTTINKWAR